MANLSKLDPETQVVLDKVCIDLGLDKFADVRGFYTDSEKAPLVKLSKPNKVYEFELKSNKVIHIVINRIAFQQLSDEDVYLILWDALQAVNYNFEKDVIKLSTPQIVVSLAGLEKHGDKLLKTLEIATRLSIQNAEESQE